MTRESSFLPDLTSPGLIFNSPTAASVKAHTGGPHVSLSCFCFLWEPCLKLPQAVIFWERGRSSTFKKVHHGKSPSYLLLVLSFSYIKISFCHQPESRLFPEPRSQIPVMLKDRPCSSEIRQQSAAFTSLHHSQVGPINANTQHGTSRTLSLSNG